MTANSKEENDTGGRPRIHLSPSLLPAWQALLVLLMILGTSFHIWAQQSSVFISIRGPEDGTALARKEYEEIKNILGSNLEFKLSSEFLIEDNRDAADYVLELIIDGPLQECYWQVTCNWKGKEASRSKKCWNKVAYLPYCRANPLEDIVEIGCLADFVDLGSTPKTLPKNLCATDKIPNQSSFKIVYTRCFCVQLEDEAWKSRVRLHTPKIPLRIMQEFEADFRKHGYDITPELCLDTDEEPKKVDVEIWGFVEEVPNKDRLVVELFVHERRPLGQHDNFLDRLGGRTREISYEEHMNIGDAIIDYIRERLDDKN